MRLVFGTVKGVTIVGTLNAIPHSNISMSATVCAETSSIPIMTPYDFDAPDADVILRSSDGKEFRVHRLILSLTSPVFQGMFSLPQSTDPPSQILSVDVPESSDVLQPFIQYLYPHFPPKISDISMWAALYTIGNKYIAGVVMGPLRDMLIPRFLEKSPMRVYALASHWGFEGEAKIASRRTLRLDISKELSEEDATLMGGAACQKLYLLHYNRREAAQRLINNQPPPSASNASCKCSPPSCRILVSALCQRVATKPWLTAEEVFKDAARSGYPARCNDSCRHAYKNMHAYLTSLLEGVSKLPQTI